MVAATALVIAGCGTRVDEAEVIAGAGGGPVRIDQSVLEQLRSATAPAPDGAAVTGSTPAGPSSVTVNAPPRAADGPARDTGGAPATDVAEAGRLDGAATSPRDAAFARNNDDRRGPPWASAAAAADSAAAVDARCTREGAPIALGQIGSFSGVVAPITASGRTALAVWAKDVNSRGGLACHPVRIFVADDGADPARAAAAVADLTGNKDVQAIVGAFTTLSQAGLNSAVEKAGIPVVGGDVGDFSWFSHPNLFPQGPGLISWIRGALQQTIGSGNTKLGLLYCVEAVLCASAAKIIDSETPKLGAELVYSSPVSLIQTDFTAQCQNARSEGAQAIGLGLDGSAMGRVARSCAALGYFPQFFGTAIAVSPQQAEDPNLRRNTLSVAGANAPFMRSDTPGQREFQAAMQRYAPGLPLDAVAMAAWASGKLLEAAVAGLGPAARLQPITTETIFAGLGTITKETLNGLAPPITFTPGQRAAPAIDCSYFSLLTEKGWTATSSRPVCAEDRKNGNTQQRQQSDHAAAAPGRAARVSFRSRITPSRSHPNRPSATHHPATRT